ncbi:hypothetical protein RchiOBHm_Chr4g0415361 [Rosa chinensis]|uniref:Uncharacterized protein n=1 Tax=Rosa chinensis TaxID=74649 RepID=A0A2P6QWI6_ROSCH|nr:hypothetical protein RchiOBHm_Chr4g0415361 [Rosa chinensis]
MVPMVVPCQEFSKGERTEPWVHVWIKNYSRRGLSGQICSLHEKVGGLEGDQLSNHRQLAFLLAQCTIHGAEPSFGGGAFPSF